jgi:hypothetical protein
VGQGVIRLVIFAIYYPFSAIGRCLAAAARAFFMGFPALLIAIIQPSH